MDAAHKYEYAVALVESENHWKVTIDCDDGPEGSLPEVLSSMGRAGWRLHTIIEMGAVFERIPFKENMEAVNKLMEDLVR